MNRSRVVTLLVATVGSSACGKDAAAPNGPLTGTWAASNAGRTAEFTLHQSGQSVTGTGMVTSGPNSATLVITGSHVPPYVNLMLNPDQNFVAFRFDGRLIAVDTVTGVFNGSGFVDLGMVFVRRP